MLDNGASQRTAQDISVTIPANRKRCEICCKILYYHQPFLICSGCKNAYHGKCIKLSNEKLFILQQYPWHCLKCEVSLYSCETCFTNICIYDDKFTQCKQCFKILHVECIKSNVCLSCLPVPLNYDHINYSSIDHVNNDFYNNQPIFTPFEFYNSEVVDFIPDAEILNDNLEHCNQILSQCKYYTCNEFVTGCKFEYINFVGFNIDGVRTNFDNFLITHDKLSLNNSKTIINGYFLCETNVTEFEAQSYYIPNYNKFVLDRLKKADGSLKQKGSGLIIFLSDMFTNVKIKSEFNISSTDFEILGLEVNLKTEKLLLINCYRSPSGNFNNFIDGFADLLSKINDYKEHKSYILGDLNVNLFNSNSNNCTKYLDCIFSNNFLPIISRATHFGGQNGTLIDHILTNDMSKIYSSGIIRCNISRHLPTFVCLDYNFDSSNPRTARPRVKINDYNIKNFVEEFNAIAFDLENNSAELCFTKFHDNFKVLYDKWFVNSNNNSAKGSILKSDWISIGVAKSSDYKNHLYELWINNKTSKNWNIYLNYKRIFDTIKNKEKFDYYDKCFKSNQHDLKKTWKLINGILGRKRSNRLLVFPGEKAAHNFNSYFVNVAQDLINKNINASNLAGKENNFNKYLPGVSDNEILDCEFLCSDIKDIISKLNNSKGTYFSPRILKILSPIISPVLTNLFNKCIKDGYFPKELKIAKIIPLYKNKGSISEFCNYRPISMLSVFSKIFEKLIHQQISDFFDKNNLFNNSQYGFRKKHSTVHALINAAENVYESIDKKHHTLGIFIDFSRAFDTVRHDILLHKLEHYGIRGNLHSLLTSYLTNRQQYVSYGGLESSLLKLTCGVPQGSVLGPLLFIIFVNDIVKISDIAKFVLFADDLNLFLTHESRKLLYQQANQILLNLYEYCCANKLIINYDKCCFIEFNNDSSNENYYLGILNHKFKPADKCKFLGVYFNSKLKWDDHIRHVISQLSKSCGSLYRIRKIVPQKVLRQVYISLIQPYLSYCIPLWGANCNSELMQELFVLQKKCIRIVANKTDKINNIFQHTKPIFLKLKLLTVFNMYYYYTASIAMRVLETHIPIAIFNMFIVSSRSNRMILPKLQKSSTMKSSFIFNSSKILNYFYQHDVPYYILSVNVFKHRIKNHLQKTQSISVNGDDSWLPCNHNLFSNITIS